MTAEAPVRVLIIDDDPSISLMIELVLIVEGFDVTVVESGEDGLLAALREPPDVIVLDVMMPKVDGWQVAATLRGHELLAEIPIVFCTALADDSSMWQGWEAGAASYVSKPFEPEDLIDEIRRVVGD